MGEGHIIIRKEIVCAECIKTECPLGMSAKCINMIEPNEVYLKVKHIFDKSSNM